MESERQNGSNGRVSVRIALRDLLLDGRRRSLSEIASALGVASIDRIPGLQAQVHDLSKPKSGTYKVTTERVRMPSGLVTYYTLRVLTEEEIKTRKEKESKKKEEWVPLRVCAHCGKKHRCGV